MSDGPRKPPVPLRCKCGAEWKPGQKKCLRARWWNWWRHQATLDTKLWLLHELQDSIMLTKYSAALNRDPTDYEIMREYERLHAELKKSLS